MSAISRSCLWDNRATKKTHATDFRCSHQMVHRLASSIPPVGSFLLAERQRFAGRSSYTSERRKGWVILPLSRQERSRQYRGLEVRAERGETTAGASLSTSDHPFQPQDSPVWEKVGAVVRLSYGIGIYGAMALAGNFMCSVVGVDSMGGFNCSVEAFLNGLGYAVPPILALLFILDDKVVKVSPHARAIRDVEEEELRSFFKGMSPWQFMLMVAASSVGEELFYRAAIQGGLAHMFLRGTDLVKDAPGIACLAGMFPPFVPFAQAFAAVVTAALTGSLYYIATSPNESIYVVAPSLSIQSGREDLRKLLAAWSDERQMKKIYSPLLEGLLGLYLGVEWIQTGNIFAPMITHGIYSTVILGHVLWKIHGQRHTFQEQVREEITSNK